MTTENSRVDALTRESIETIARKYAGAYFSGLLFQDADSFARFTDEVILAASPVEQPAAAPIGRKTSNPHRGGTQAYLATEHFNEGWNACLDAIAVHGAPSPADERVAYDLKAFEAAVWALVDLSRSWEKAYVDSAVLYDDLDSHKSTVERELHFLVRCYREGREREATLVQQLQRAVARAASASETAAEGVSSELLPCPFCGGEPKRITLNDEANFGGDVIACTKCDCCTHVEFGEKSGLVDAWNSRITPSRSPAMAAEAVAIPAGYGLTAEQLATLQSNGLKPEEIGGDASTQHDRVRELVHWFARFARGEANPKWAHAHAFELAYFIASNGQNRHIDLREISDKAYLEGVNISASDRGILERLGKIAPQPSAQADARVGLTVGQQRTVECADAWLTDKGLPTYTELHALLAAHPCQPDTRAVTDNDKIDAGRYRTLRRGQHWSVLNGIGDTLRADELDAAIDAARAGDAS